MDSTPSVSSSDPSIPSSSILSPPPSPDSVPLVPSTPDSVSSPSSIGSPSSGNDLVVPVSQFNDVVTKMANSAWTIVSSILQIKKAVDDYNNTKATDIAATTHNVTQILTEPVSTNTNSTTPLVSTSGSQYNQPPVDSSDISPSVPYTSIGHSLVLCGMQVVVGLVLLARGLFWFRLVAFMNCSVITGALVILATLVYTGTFTSTSIVWISGFLIVLFLATWWISAYLWREHVFAHFVKDTMVSVSCVSFIHSIITLIGEISVWWMIILGVVIEGVLCFVSFSILSRYQSEKVAGDESHHRYRVYTWIVVTLSGAGANMIVACVMLHFPNALVALAWPALVVSGFFYQERLRQSLAPDGSTTDMSTLFLSWEERWVCPVLWLGRDATAPTSSPLSTPCKSKKKSKGKDTPMAFIDTPSPKPQFDTSVQDFSELEVFPPFPHSLNY